MKCEHEKEKTQDGRSGAVFQDALSLEACFQESCPGVRHVLVNSVAVECATVACLALQVAMRFSCRLTAFYLASLFSLKDYFYFSIMYVGLCTEVQFSKDPRNGCSIPWSWSPKSYVSARN